MATYSKVSKLMLSIVFIAVFGLSLGQYALSVEKPEVITAVPPEFRDASAKSLVRHAEAQTCLDITLEEVVGKVTTMVSSSRRRATFWIAKQIMLRAIPGDFLEAGVAGGGMSIVMLSVLNCYNSDKKMYMADSWIGLPAPDYEKWDEGLGFKEGEYKVEFDEFQKQMNKYKTFWIKRHEKRIAAGDTLTVVPKWRDDNQVILKGWFKDTLPTANFTSLSFLRCDGDMYEATYQCLQYGYPYLSIGGYVYIDDYWTFGACKRAVHRYRDEQNITPEETPIWSVLQLPSWNVDYVDPLKDSYFLLMPNGETDEEGRHPGEAVFWIKA